MNRKIMNKRILICLIGLLFTFTAVQAQQSSFDKIADMPGVSSVFISPKMFRLMKGANIAEDASMNRIIGKMTSLQILSCENREAADRLRKATSYINTQSGYEELMRVKEDGEQIRIYTKENNQGHEYIILTDEKDEFNAILLQGNFTLEEVQQVMKSLD